MVGEGGDDQTRPRSQLPEEVEIVEAGEVIGVGGAAPETVTIKNKVHLENAKAARWVSYTLIGILAASFVVHYTVTAILVFRGETPVETLTDLFESWLPVITTFVGSAVTFFLTREGK